MGRGYPNTQPAIQNCYSLSYIYFGFQVAKDNNDPHKPLSSYNLYMKENRERVRSENPEWSFTEITRKIAQDWKTLTPDEKQQYSDAAEEDKDRYAREVISERVLQIKLVEDIKRVFQNSAHFKLLCIFTPAEENTVRIIHCRGSLCRGV